jgi:hypothetical protein
MLTSSLGLAANPHTDRGPNFARASLRGRPTLLRASGTETIQIQSGRGPFSTEGTREDRSEDTSPSAGSGVGFWPMPL